MCSLALYLVEDALGLALTRLPTVVFILSDGVQNEENLNYNVFFFDENLFRSLARLPEKVILNFNLLSIVLEEEINSVVFYGLDNLVFVFSSTNPSRGRHG